jgi:recombination protein RecR
LLWSRAVVDDPIAELVSLLSRLPGVGERTATRYAHHLLGAERALSTALAETLATLHERIKTCERCGNWSTDATCRICTDPRRAGGELCVVARVPDLVALERHGTFRGRYHVLHALLAPLDGMGPERIDAARIRRRVADEQFREVVLATPLSVEGEATALYLVDALRGAADGLKISRLASGLPHGGELEYADPITLGRAFDHRRPL